MSKIEKILQTFKDKACRGECKSCEYKLKCIKTKEYADKIIALMEGLIPTKGVYSAKDVIDEIKNRIEGLK